MTPDNKPVPSRLRRLWRWFRWVLVVGFVGLVVVGVFHRPLILWALNRFGSDAAKRAGVELLWQVQGSLWSDLVINDLQTTVQGHQVQVKHLELHYDRAAAWRGEWLKTLTGVVAHDVKAIVDLRSPPAAKEHGPPSDPKRLVEMLKTLALPNIDLQHVTVTVLLPDATLKINDLSLILPPSREGSLHVASVEHPQLVHYPVHDVEARLQLTGTALHVKSLKVPPKIKVEQLDADASDFANGRVAVATTVRSGKASVVLNAKADLNGEHPLIDATMDVTGVDEQQAAMWMREAPLWKAKLNKLHVTAKGDVMRPRALEATVSMDVSGLGYQQWSGDAVKLEAKLASGKLEVSQLTVEAAGNRVEATATGDAPAEWAGIAKTPLQAQWKLDAPTLQSIAGLPVKLSGQASGEGSVKLDDRGLQSFAAHLNAQEVAVDQYKLRALDANATGDLKEIKFDAKVAADAGDGQLDAHGKLGIAAGAMSELAWKVVLPRPDDLVKSLKLPWPVDVATGEVSAAGALTFDLAKLKASQFNDAKGGGTLQVKEITWRGAPCPLVAAAWSLEHGKATVSALDVQLNAKSTVHVQGAMELAGEQRFDGSLTAKVPEVAALQPWVDAAAKPVPVEANLLLGDAAAPARTVLRGGSVMLDWTGSGALKGGLKLHGDATAKVEAFRMEGLPEAASLATKLTHDLDGATFKELAASYGPWAAKLRGSVSRTAVDITSIEASREGKVLANGSVLVPLDLQAKPLPIDQAKPLKVHLETAGKLVLQDFVKQATGVVRGSVEVQGTMKALQSHVEVKADDLRLPNAPSKEPGTVSVLIDLNEGVLTGDVLASVKPLEPLTAHVMTHIDTVALVTDSSLVMDSPFEASVKLNQPSLAFLKPMLPMLDELKGSVVVDAHAEGTLKTPHMQGTVMIDVPSVVPHDTDLPLVKGLKSRITAEGTVIKVESFHAMAAGGVIDLSGTCDLKDMTQPAFDVSLTARDLLAVRNDMMSLRTDADLTCKGVPGKAALTGTIGLTRGRVFQEVNFLPVSKLINDLPPLPDAQAGMRSMDPNASPLPPMLKDWTFAVDVKTKDSVRLLGNVMNGGVKVDLNVGGTGAAPQVIGAVTLEQARLRLPFSTLRITTGVVSFVADKPFAPSLELLAESTVDAYEIDLRGYGPALDPKLRFSSTPPLAEGEIATLLATGSTTSGLKKAGNDTAGRALLFLVREAYRRWFDSESKPLKPGEIEDESRFIVQERSEDGALGGVTGIYEFSQKMKVVGSTNKDGGFRAMFHYLWKFD